jgi:hypothetical protein
VVALTKVDKLARADAGRRVAELTRQLGLDPDQ